MEDHSIGMVPELLAPAGDPERLRFAVYYGADAVYAGLNELNLRSGAGNFNCREFEEGVNFAHRRGVKVYATVNIMAHNRHLDKVAPLLRFLHDCGTDGIIVSDPGIAETVKEITPEIPLHLSTQANATNWKTVAFWYRLGFKRINLARELTLEEIYEIRQKVTGVELETFVHGAMCMAYSGRCLLSAYFTDREANLGECTHPCRWKYYLVEEYRPDELLPVLEDEEGSYILSSRDLCMIDYLPDLCRAGLNSIKIEGRMKTIHYVATVTRVYREALDTFARDPDNYRVIPYWKEELEKVSHRPYSTGFFYGSPLQVDPATSQSYFKQCVLAGVVLDYYTDQGKVLVEQRNNFGAGDELEVLRRTGAPFTIKVNRIFNEEGEEMSRAPHPQQRLLLPVDIPLEKGDLLRLYKQSG